MDEPILVEFGFGERERLEFAFSRSDLRTKSWSHPTVTVSCGRFCGSAEVYCDLDDFARLLPQLEILYETLRGTATLCTIENQVAFTVTGDGLGHIELKGFLKQRTDGRNRLNFSLAFDQTALPASIRGIQKLLKSCPE